jgi:D-alanyl-D-alanine carboxypeptidase/D-alanyl-D-alanine-endopeptidase (penicillin-binding protein 4)
MNLYAEALCKRLGHAVTGQPGSWASGTAAVGDFMKKIGVAPSQFTLVDGCGLSRENAVSSNAITTLLEYDFFSPNAQVFRESLGVAGVDGTLGYRFKGSDLRGRVLAKSGYIDGVSSLSGYLHAKDDAWYAFSILMNKLPDKTNNMAKSIKERIITAVDRGTVNSTTAKAGAD